MQIVKPDKVNIVDTNVPADSTANWDSGTSYNEGDVVQYNNYIYTALTSTTGDEPDKNPLIWNKDRPTNQWAAFDGFTDTATTLNDDIYYKFNVSDVDKIGFFGLYGKSVEVKLTNNTNGDIVFDKIINLETYNVSDWYEWTYNTPIYRKDLVVTIPTLIYDATLEVTITKIDKAEVAHIVYGRTSQIGVSLVSPKNPLVSRRMFIKKERSPDGRLYVKPGVRYKRMHVPVMIETKAVDSVLQTLDEINGIPALFIGDDREDGFESLLVYGIFKDLDIPITTKISMYELIIEGVG